MGRRLFVCMTVLGCLLLPGAGKVEAQLSKAEVEDISNKMIASTLGGMAIHNHGVMAQSGCTGYSANQPQYSLLMPSDEGAQGGLAITNTIYASNVSGNLPSHGITGATPGTWIGINVTVYGPNIASRSWYYTVNGGSTHYGAGSATNPGNWSNPQTWINSQAWLVSSAEVGQTIEFFNLVTNTNGITSLDRAPFTVIAGSGPSIVDQDEIPANLYMRGRFSFGVPPMTQACQQCINDPSSCLGANHTPYITATLRNVNTGETRSVTHAVAGIDFNENEYGNGSTDGYPFDISVLPGDGPDPTDDTTTGEIFCFAVGADIFDQHATGNEVYKIMKTKIKIASQGSTTAGVTRWYVDSWCIDPHYAPIWEPLYIDTAGGITPLIKVGQYELSEQDCWANPGDPNWTCPPITVTPPQPLHIGVGGTKYNCSTLFTTPVPK